MLVSIVLAITEISIFSNNKGGLNTEQVVFLVCNGIMIFMSLILLYLSTQLTRKSPAPIILTIYAYYIVAFVYSIFVEIDHRENRNDGINYFFIVIFICAYTSHLRVLMFKHMILFYITAVIGWVIIKIIYSSSSIEQTMFLLCVIYSTMVNHFSSEKSFRISFNYERSLNHEIKRTQALLRNLVPPNVFRGLLKGKRIADHIQNVTLLYTDMCGFTAFSKTREPKEVVELLSKLFQRMDNLCIKNNVYKVHTIGDCYVVSGYTGKVSNEKRDIYQEAANVIETGFDMLDIIRDVREELAIQELDMRIGIHTGMMTAGIIGSNIVRYDIFGSDVLIANKMESSGLNGHVCCSEDTRKILIENFPDKYKFAKHVTVPVENLNKKVKEYIVSRNENQEGAGGSRFMSSESSSDDENEASAH